MKLCMFVTKKNLKKKSKGEETEVGQEIPIEKLSVETETRLQEMQIWKLLANDKRQILEAPVQTCFRLKLQKELQGNHPDNLKEVRLEMQRTLDLSKENLKIEGMWKDKMAEPTEIGKIVSKLDLKEIAMTDIIAVA